MTTAEADALEQVEQRINSLCDELERIRWGGSTRRVMRDLKTAVDERNALRQAAVERREAALLQRIAELEKQLGSRAASTSSAGSRT